MRILVTGSSGRLGGEVVTQLRRRGHQTRGVDLIAGEGTDVIADAGSAETVQLVRRVDAVIHTASLHSPHVGSRDRAEFIHTNVTATSILLQAAAAAGLLKFIYTSTTSVYGR